MTRAITRLNALDMAVLLMIFEGSTLFILGMLAGKVQGAVTAGIIDGVAGTLLALGTWHALKLRLRGSFGSITRIALMGASIANAAFLSVLFLVQEWLAHVQVPVLLGFLSVALAAGALLAAYNALPFKLAVVLNTKHARILRASPVLAVAVLAGTYEAIILPLMDVLFRILPFGVLLTYTLTGVISGFVGGLLGTFVFNLLAPKLTPRVEFR